jgi:predicted transposase YdaD
MPKPKPKSKPKPAGRHDSEHDQLFRTLLAPVEALPRWLPPMLPPALSSLIDWGSLSVGVETVFTKGRRRRQADAVFRCKATRGDDLLLVIQLEHQARPDADMPRRRLEMAVARMALGEAGPMPSVVSVVFYQGPERWTGPRSLSEQRGHAEPMPGLVHLEPVFIDLSRLPPEQLPSGDDEQSLGLRCTLELLSVARRPDLWAQVARRARLLRRLRAGGVREQLIGYIHGVARTGPSPEQQAIIDGALAEEGPNMGLWLNRVIRESEARGRQEGIEQGIEQGIEKGIEQGIEKGIEQGIEKGRQQAAAGLLRRGLQFRFGPLSAAHEDRLQQASVEELDGLVERLFGAGSIDEVFAG